jgi:hypothetical protein
MLAARPHATTQEQRTATRVPAARIPAIQGVRISPSDVVSPLVNISISGCLVECISKPRPGSAVTVHFLGGFTPASLRGRVARTIVASLGKDGVLHYMVGIAFDQTIDLEEFVTPVEAPAPAAGADGEPPSKAVSRLQNRW